MTVPPTLLERARAAARPQVTGAVTGAPLMDLAQQLADGEIAEGDAIARGRAVILEATAAR